MRKKGYSVGQQVAKAVIVEVIKNDAGEQVAYKIKRDCCGAIKTVKKSGLAQLKCRIKQGQTGGKCYACTMKQVNSPDHREKKAAENWEWAKRVWFEAMNNTQREAMQ